MSGFHLSSSVKGIVVTVLAVALLNVAYDFETLRLPVEKRDLKWLDLHLPAGDMELSKAANAGWSVATATANREASPPESLPSFDTSAEPEPEPAEAAPGPKCLGLGENEELERMISRYDLIYVISHAKSGSSTMKFFAEDCTGVSRYATWLHSTGRTQEYLKELYPVPPFVSARLTSESSFLRLTQNAITSSLMIYIHREDTERFKSSIKQVVTTTSGKLKKRDVVDEEDIYKEIAVQSHEIRSGSRLLTCPVYRSIEENRSNVVFVGIENMDDLLRLLIRNYCPSGKRRHVNKGTNKPSKRVRLGKKTAKQAGGTDGTVSLDEWIEAKWPLLEHAFEQRSGASCHGETRRIEQEVLACPDRAYWYSSHEFPVWHPFTNAVSLGRAANPFTGAEPGNPGDNKVPDEYLDDEDDDR